MAACERCGVVLQRTQVSARGATISTLCPACEEHAVDRLWPLRYRRDARAYPLRVGMGPDPFAPSDADEDAVTEYKPIPRPGFDGVRDDAWHREDQSGLRAGVAIRARAGTQDDAAKRAQPTAPAASPSRTQDRISQPLPAAAQPWSRSVRRLMALLQPERARDVALLIISAGLLATSGTLIASSAMQRRERGFGLPAPASASTNATQDDAVLACFAQPSPVPEIVAGDLVLAAKSSPPPSRRATLASDRPRRSSSPRRTARRPPPRRVPTKLATSGSVLPELPERPTRDQVRVALRVALALARKCGLSGQASVTIHVNGPLGRVSDVAVQGMRGKAGSCIEDAIRKTPFPRFRQQTFAVEAPFRFGGT